jgi:hypothetical protein
MDMVTSIHVRAHNEKGNTASAYYSKGGLIIARPTVLAFGGNALLPDPKNPGCQEETVDAFARAVRLLMPTMREWSWFTATVHRWE